MVLPGPALPCLVRACDIPRITPRRVEWQLGTTISLGLHGMVLGSARDQPCCCCLDIHADRVRNE